MGRKVKNKFSIKQIKVNKEQNKSMSRRIAITGKGKIKTQIINNKLQSLKP